VVWPRFWGGQSKVEPSSVVGRWVWVGKPVVAGLKRPVALVKVRL